MPEENLVWKDTVLVRTGETVDILLDVTNIEGTERDAWFSREADHGSNRPLGQMQGPG